MMVPLAKRVAMGLELRKYFQGMLQGEVQEVSLEGLSTGEEWLRNGRGSQLSHFCLVFWLDRGVAYCSEDTIGRHAFLAFISDSP